MPLTYSDLSGKYREFSVPTLKIKSGGSEIPLKDLTIKNVEVQLGTGFEASMASFEVFEIYDLDARTFNKTHMDSYFTLGKTIQIYLGYIETSLVFEGYIESVKAVFTEDGFPHIAVECLDVKGLMMHGVKSAMLNLKNYSDVVKKILGTYGSLASSSTVDSCSALEREIQQNKETDYTFLCRLAKSINYEFFVLQGKVYFRKPAYSDSSAAIQFDWGGMLINFTQERCLAKYVGKVTVKGYDDQTHKVIESTASSPVSVGGGSKKPSQIVSQLSSSSTVVIDYEINTVEEAKERAAAELNSRSMNFITGSGRTVGLPELVPGKYVQVKNLDPDVDHLYYVTRVIHKFNNGDFFTEFQAGANQL